MNTGKKLTKRLVESIESPQEGKLLVRNIELKGFGVRIFPTGRKTYFVQYRNEFFVHTRRKKIGVHGAITAELVRDEAEKILGDVAKGETSFKNFQKAKKKPMFPTLASEYLEGYARNNKHSKSYKKDQRISPQFDMEGPRQLIPIVSHTMGQSWDSWR